MEGAKWVFRMELMTKEREKRNKENGFLDIFLRIVSISILLVRIIVFSNCLLGLGYI